MSGEGGSRNSFYEEEWKRRSCSKGWLVGKGPLVPSEAPSHRHRPAKPQWGILRTLLLRMILAEGSQMDGSARIQCSKLVTGSRP
jgi:hypothetical protein